MKNHAHYCALCSAERAACKCSGRYCQSRMKKSLIAASLCFLAILSLVGAAEVSISEAKSSAAPGSGSACPRVVVGSREDIVLPDTHPVIYVIKDEGGGGTGDLRNAKLRAAAERDAFLREHGDKRVQLTSSNAHSHGKRVVPLREYMETMNVDLYMNAGAGAGAGADASLAENGTDTSSEEECSVHVDVAATTAVPTGGASANETWYLFGNNEHLSPFKELSELYELPKCGQDCTRVSQKAAVVSGLGGKGSGVSFHFHGPGLSETLYGRKRWFLYAPEYEPDMISDIESGSGSDGGISGFDAMVNTTVASWVQSASFGTVKRRDARKVQANLPFRLPHKNEKERALSSIPGTDSNSGSSSVQPHVPLPFYDCTIEPGEALYFPSQWMHATLNLDEYTYFVSVFLP